MSARLERAATSMTRWHRLVPCTAVVCPARHHVPNPDPERVFRITRCQQCRRRVAIWRMLDGLALVAEVSQVEHMVISKLRMGAAEAGVYLGVLRLLGETAA